MAAAVDSATSVKRALLVGCNYKGTEAALGGCINDTELWRKLLVDCFEFPEENITILTDDHKDSGSRPTKEGIKKHLNDIVDVSKEGDILFFHFSGHGAQEDDQPGGDEEDGKDELLVTADLEFLHDDELREIVLKLKSGVKFTMISDSCCSGTILDKTETIIDGQDEVFDSSKVEEIKSELMSALEFQEILQSELSDKKHRGLPPSVLKELTKSERSNLKSADVQDSTETSTERTYQPFLHRGIVITGCRSSETSADTLTIKEHKHCGLLSYVATEQIRICKEQDSRIMTNRELVLRVNYIAHKKGYSQHVRLEGLPGKADEKFVLW